MTESRHCVHVESRVIDVSEYLRMHRERIDGTISKIVANGAHGVVEVGSHPWVMTSALVEHPQLELLATVSAEEATLWPDDFAPSENTLTIQTVNGISARIKNYSFNVERRRLSIREQPDTVLACEIIEHLVRAPHTMLLNINDWLPEGGLLFVSTPNGCQFMNPFRRVERMPAYRAHCYERHSYAFRLAGLVELIELCGFSVKESGFWNPYGHSARTRLRELLAGIPGDYFAEKFGRSLYVLAHKLRPVNTLERTPSIYSRSNAWEYIAHEDL